VGGGAATAGYPSAPATDGAGLVAI
jgi:hypothetical protein